MGDLEEIQAACDKALRDQFGDLPLWRPAMPRSGSR